jgi:hypothetical protein
MPRTHVAHPAGSDAPRAVPAPESGSALGVSSIVRVILPALLLATVLLVVVIDFTGPLSNPDTYFHLRFGREFLDGWSLHDPGSVTSQATAHWVPTQWLPEIVMAKFDDWFGLAGVAWLAGLQVMGLVAALWVAARRRAEPLLAVALVMAALLGSSIGLSARPQVISYVLVVITVDAWLRTADDGRARWWLVPMTWVWAMCHGMWPVGIAIGGVVLVGMALDRRTTMRRWWLLACVPALSAVAAALTPVGPELYVQELRVQDRSAFFSEWHSPHLTNHACLAVGFLLVLTLIALVCTPWRGWVTVLLFVAAAGCAVWTWRTVPVAAVMLVPVGAPALQELTRRRSAGPRRPELVLLAAGCAGALAVLGVLVPHQVPDPTRDPGWLQPAMTSLPPDTKVLSTWSTSAILMWRFPDLDLVANGYGDAYTVPELQRSSDLQSVAPGWEDDLRATGAEIAVLPTDNPLAEALVRDEHWKVIHRSSGLAMLQAPAVGTS